MEKNTKNNGVNVVIIGLKQKKINISILKIIKK